MAIERERKFLVRDDSWRAGAEWSVPLRQGYLAADEERSVRVRVAGERAWITIKGRAHGTMREEFEYEIPRDDAESLLDRLCLEPVIEKVRHRVAHDGRVWEVDEFAGENAGLIVAEIEFDEGDEPKDLPAWAGDEVTHDPRYLNANLFREPYARWK